MKLLPLSAIFRLLCWALLIAASAYFIYRNIPQFFTFTQASYGDYYWPKHTMLFLHICGGLTATVLGPFQFIARIRKNYVRVHRFMGRTYLVSILLGSIAGMYLAITSNVNLAYTLGLASLAVVWFTTSLMAFICIKNGNISLHREWMIKSYVITFAFTTFRLLYQILSDWNVSDSTTRLTLLSWACWAIPLFVAELILQAGKIKTSSD